jgi:hypothetical protein
MDDACFTGTLSWTREVYPGPVVTTGSADFAVPFNCTRIGEPPIYYTEIFATTCSDPIHVYIMLKTATCQIGLESVDTADLKTFVPCLKESETGSITVEGTAGCNGNWTFNVTFNYGPCNPLP